MQVFCRFDGQWVSGFVVAGYVVGDAGSVRVKRLSDGSELPAGFALADVRAETEPIRLNR